MSKGEGGLYTHTLHDVCTYMRILTAGAAEAGGLGQAVRSEEVIL